MKRYHMGPLEARRYESASHRAAYVVACVVLIVCVGLFIHAQHKEAKERARQEVAD